MFSNKNMLIAFRIISWQNVFKKYKRYFIDMLNQYKIKYHQAIFCSLLNYYLYNGYDDKRISKAILEKNKSLFSDAMSIELLSYFEDELRKIINLYKNTNIKFLISLDSFYPKEFINVLNNNLKSKQPQYVPIIFEFIGNLNLLYSNYKKLAIIGTRECKHIEETKKEIIRIKHKYIDSICVTGLASGVDTYGILSFDKSICFISEDIDAFMKKKNRDSNRLSAKYKVANNGLILSHIFFHQQMSSIDYKKALLQRNLFVVLLSDSIHPIEFGIKSGTISAINYAIINNKKIYTPRRLVSYDVIERFKNNITFY